MILDIISFTRSRFLHEQKKNILFNENYCFIPQTKEEGEADPIDVFILGNSSLLPESVISCRPVGILLTEDQGGTEVPIWKKGNT